MTLFVEQGYERFSLRALAREMGCSHATPYRYFRDKAEIFAVVRAEGFRQFGAFLEARLDGIPDPEQRLRTLAVAYCDFATDHATAFSIIFATSTPTPAGHGFVQEAGFEAWSVLYRTVAEAILKGVIVGEPNTLAHLFWSGIHGVAMLGATGNLNVGIDAATLTSAMATTLLDAHRPTSGAFS